ncbi:MAG: chemotaxis protein CheD [Clostridiales Family XIII bacterium]|jgi:chemotaxis protein CheD|nr:chemotaxis protein CheD [Clostridiales Family XIII bacterium]
MEETIVIGIADFKLAKAPVTLVTYALGSCVGISIYDERAKIGGLAHIMLPYSSMMQHHGPESRLKFADTGIADMLDALLHRGASKSALRAKIAGGANMFKSSATSSLSAVGMQNVESVRTTLRNLEIPIIAEDTGRDYGRTVYVDMNNGEMRIRSLGNNILVL